MNTQNKQTKININTSDNGNYCNEANTVLEVINNSSEIESENTHLKSSNDTVSSVASQSKDSISKSEKSDETSNVNEDAQIVLIVNGDPIINLTDSQAKIIERCITDGLNRSLKKRLAFQLAFHNKELSNGRYKITCANTDTMDWLVNTMKGRSKRVLWYGANLRVMVNECYRVSVLLPNFDDTYYDLVDLIRAQNPGIETDLWKLFEKIPKTNGNLFVLGINKDSLDFIEANEGELFYGIGVIRFRRVLINGINDEGEIVKIKRLNREVRKCVKRLMQRGLSYEEARKKANDEYEVKQKIIKR